MNFCMPMCTFFISLHQLKLLILSVANARCYFIFWPNVASNYIEITEFKMWGELHPPPQKTKSPAEEMHLQSLQYIQSFKMSAQNLEYLQRIKK